MDLRPRSEVSIELHYQITFKLDENLRWIFCLEYPSSYCLLGG